MAAMAKCISMIAHCHLDAFKAQNRRRRIEILYPPHPTPELKSVISYSSDRVPESFLLFFQAMLETVYRSDCP